LSSTILRTLNDKNKYVQEFNHPRRILAMKIQPKLLINRAVQIGVSQVKETGGLPENKVDGAGHGSIKKKPSFHGFIFENNPNFTSLRKVIEQLTSSFRNQGFGHFGFPKIGGQIGSSLTGIGDIIRTISSIKNSIGNIRNLF
jgi:hypothetical protein